MTCDTFMPVHTERQREEEDGRQKKKEKQGERNRNFIISYEADIIFIKPQTV